MENRKITETTFFKIYIHDVGLLATKSELDVKTLLEGNRIFEEFKGALTEQYVLQEMITNPDALLSSGLPRRLAPRNNVPLSATRELLLFERF